MDLNEKIIECVRKHSCLYDPGDKNYKNAVLKSKIWQQIAAKLNETSDNIKKKWKSMRDGYVKYKKQVKGTTGSERKPLSFMWSAQLTFLDSGITPRETVSNITECNETQTANSDTSPSLPSTPVTTNANLEDSRPGTSSDVVSTFQPFSIHSKQPMEPTATPCRAKKRIAEPDEPDLDQMIKSYIENKKGKPSYDHDAIDYLFLSYARTFKKFSLRKQATLKVDLAKLFSEAELSEIATTDSSTYSVISSVQENTNSDTNTITVFSYDTNVEQDSNIPQDLSNSNVLSNGTTVIYDTNAYCIHSDNAQCNTNIRLDNFTE